jgi:hypothetical protein
MRWLSIGAAALALAASARAATPLVPPFVQSLVRTKAGELAYVPTSAPVGYRYLSYGWRSGANALTIRLNHHNYPPNGKHAIVFRVTPFGGPLGDCPSGKVKTMQLRGNKVYWDGAAAWRCVRTPDGVVLRESASGPNLPDVALGRVVASAKSLS